jgi:DNA-binding SARP family transcriptional activator
VDAAPARVTLLGGFQLEVGAGRAAELPRGVQRLVAHLGLSHHPARAAVAGLLWPHVPEEQAHGSLRSALWRLQKAAPGLVDSSCGRLSLDRDVRVDVRDTVRWARAVLDPRRDDVGTPPPECALSGELLPGWYDDWVLAERERLRQLRLYAMEALAERLGRQGRHGEAVQAAYAAIRTEPLREAAHRTLVRIHLAEGNTAEALRAYESFRRLLEAELGESPSGRMVELVAGLRRPHLTRTVLPFPGRRTADGAAPFR